MNGAERMSRVLKREKADRIGFYEHFWNDTQNAWAEQGMIRPGELMADHFSFDLEQCRPFNMTADINKVPEIIAETEDTILQRDGNGALLKRHKIHDSTPEHVDYLVHDGDSWNAHIKPLLSPGDERINFGIYEEARNRCAKAGRFFAWCDVQAFECMHTVCGHENLLAGMALEPEWVRDMAETYSGLFISLLEILFSKSGKPDGIWFAEDMGYKNHPFMSPAMYKEFVFPAHKKVFDFAHSLGLPVIMHSCGFIEPLLPYIIESGIDCLQAIEVKAGMDLIKLYRQYGDRISFMGGLDVRALTKNDRAMIDKELETKIPVVKQGFGYTLHSDHSIPKTVEYETYAYFVEKGLNLGGYNT